MSAENAERAPALVVDYTGRGAVVWRAGRLRFAGPRCQNRIELEKAVEALFEMEEVDITSPEQVRDALLTIGGARVRRDLRASPRQT